MKISQNYHWSGVALSTIVYRNYSFPRNLLTTDFTPLKSENFCRVRSSHNSVSSIFLMQLEPISLAIRSKTLKSFSHNIEYITQYLAISKTFVTEQLKMLCVCDNLTSQLLET